LFEGVDGCLFGFEGAEVERLLGCRAEFGEGVLGFGLVEPGEEVEDGDLCVG
jgi:hypothetical protein